MNRLKSKIYIISKQLFDITASISALALLSPLILLISLAILICDRKPIIYKQIRVGKNGKYFNIYKFKTMITNSSSNNKSLITANADNRITKLGSILRKTKLDELPQLINVLLLQMSLVGPRPEVPKFVNKEEIAWKKVLLVKPGITDYATLHFRNEDQFFIGINDTEKFYSEVILPEKLSLNLIYLRNRSFLKDFLIILRTILISFIPSLTPKTSQFLLNKINTYKDINQKS